MGRSPHGKCCTDEARNQRPRCAQAKEVAESNAFDRAAPWAVGRCSANNRPQNFTLQGIRHRIRQRTTRVGAPAKA